MHARTIGILGGSFDPPHLGHLEVANMAKEHLGEVWVIPCGYRDDKPSMSSYDIRYEMCLALFTQYKVFDYERNKPLSPTYVLVKSLEDAYRDFKFYFIIGSDLLSQIHTWNKTENLLNEIDFLVFNRIGYDVSQELYDKYLTRPNFILANTRVSSSLSSTFIRNFVRNARKESHGQELIDRINEVIGVDGITQVIARYDLYN